jgi:hypothetical protein
MILDEIVKQRNYNLRSYGSNNIIVGGRVVSSAAGGLGFNSQSNSRLNHSGSGPLDPRKVNTYES